VRERAASPEHPWSELFDERRPERVVIISRDGKTKVGYLSTRQKKVDWNGLARVLRRDYKRNATTAVKKINQLLSQYDAIDSRKKQVEAQLASSKADKDERKTKKYEKQLAELLEDKAKLEKEEKKLRDLGLRRAIKREKAAKASLRG
jgi:hypothetical protein